MIFAETREAMARLGLPQGDAWDLPTSGRSFPDGALWRSEVPTVNSADAMRALLETAKNVYGMDINRVDDTYGIVRHTKQEIQEYVAIAKDFGCELNFSVGPRATYDTGATVLSQQGVRVGYRLRGMEQLVRAIEDVKRAIDLGVRGIICYDEGMLWVMAQMRKEGSLPKNLHIKLSAHMGACNPASFKLFETLGADTINPIRDLQLPMIAALRQAVSVPIDLHTDNPPASGGFIRTYEAPEMVRVASPLYLKSGNSAVSAHGVITNATDGRNMAAQCAIVRETMLNYFPEAEQSKPGQPDMAVPE